MNQRIAVFAYGSLVSRDEATRTLGRAIEDLVPARLPGWRRRWSQCRDNRAVEKTFARADDGMVPPFCLGLNLEPGEGDGPNGALLELGEAELHRLDRRELRYDRVEATTGVEPPGGLDRVFFYVAKQEHHRPAHPDGAVIIAAYLREVETAFANLGPGELELFRATTEPPPVEVVDGLLVRDEIPSGNPREW